MDDEHYKQLKKGVKSFNVWRNENIIHPDLKGADFSGAYLRGAILFGADLSETCLNETNLRDANLSRSKLIRASLIQANLEWSNLKNSKLMQADLSKADLSGADLRGANLFRADLSGANLSDANLNRANLCKATLTRTDLSGANLSEANLSGADLSNAYLNQANLEKANLSKSNMSDATLYHTNLAFLNLNETKGLDEVCHYGPSFIDTHTLYKSNGDIPEKFLRGCGAPDNLIEYLPSLTGKAIEYYSCFISYSHNDEKFAQRLHADLQDKGVRCWYAPEDMKIGDKIRTSIDQSIRIHDKLLIILSESSVTSGWVEHEVEHALDMERTRNTSVLFPVRVDNAVMDSNTGWAGNVKRLRHIGNFTRWKDHDSYEKAFERLLRDLKTEDSLT